MKKVINIGLIVFVLALWGTIIYRYVNNYFYPQSSIIEEDYNQYSLIKINSDGSSRSDTAAISKPSGETVGKSLCE